MRDRKQGARNRALPTLREAAAVPDTHEEITDLKKLSWLRLESGRRKSDDLTRVRRRTDQMMKHQQALKESAARPPQKEAAGPTECGR
jgi:hypothetical protein